MDRPAPDLVSFAEAQDAKRAVLGSDLTFLAPALVDWPPGTPIDPDSGEPYDPTIRPLSSVQSMTLVRCGVFFKAVNRGGAAQAALGSPAGWEERTRIFAIAPYSAKAVVEEAVAFVFHGQQFKIDVVKEDEIVLGYRRLLIYASVEGEQT